MKNIYYIVLILFIFFICKFGFRCNLKCRPGVHLLEPGTWVSLQLFPLVDLPLRSVLFNENVCQILTLSHYQNLCGKLDRWYWYNIWFLLILIIKSLTKEKTTYLLFTFLVLSCVGQDCKPLRRRFPKRNFIQLGDFFCGTTTKRGGRLF